MRPQLNSGTLGGAMASGKNIFSATAIGFALSLACDAVARGAAQIRAGHDIELLLPDTFSAALLFLPILLVTAASGHAEAFHSRRAVVLTWFLALPPYTYWTYRGVYGSLRAHDLHHWTASGLSAGLAWLASLLGVMVAVPTALFLAPRLPSFSPSSDAVR